LPPIEAEWIREALSDVCQAGGNGGDHLGGALNSDLPPVVGNAASFLQPGKQACSCLALTD
jgi:hypothetical protein